MTERMDEPARLTPAVAGPGQEPPPRRVGSMTMGLALIAAGLCILGIYFVPGFPAVTVLKLAPLVLVALGAEMLWRSRSGARVRYDLVGVCISLVLLGAGCVASLVPMVLEYYRPGQYEMVRAAAQRQVDACLDGAQVYRAQVTVALNGRPGMTDEQARQEARIYCDVELYGPFDSAEAFAAACQAQARALEPADLSGLYVSWGDGSRTMTLWLDPALALQASAGQLAAQVQLETNGTVDEEGYENA